MAAFGVEVIDFSTAERVAHIMGPSSAHARALSEISGRRDEDLILVRPKNSPHILLVVARSDVTNGSVPGPQIPWTEHC